jgi:NAD(P)-dependent dehydrogenase (short-subunit alcohol dehydrogenase family)
VAGVEWDVDQIGDLSGRVALITGAGSGIGLATARQLAAAGATTLLGCRSTPAGNLPGTVLPLDLASLASVREAAAAVRAEHPRLDLLINNAGLVVPRRASTADGFELLFGTNHLGHFALTGLLLPCLTAAPAARVVTVSSDAHARETLDLTDLDWQRRRYRPMAAYAQSKLANLLFGYELQHRLAAAGSPVTSYAVHPGWVKTGVQRNVPAPIGWISGTISRILGQPDPAAGARATLRAATDPGLRGGEYLAPANNRGGPPVVARSSPRSYDTDLQQQLWTASEKLTGVHYR